MHLTNLNWFGLSKDRQYHVIAIQTENKSITHREKSDLAMAEAILSASPKFIAGVDLCGAVLH
jgi:hypothetical protein